MKIILAISAFFEAIFLSLLTYGAGTWAFYASIVDHFPTHELAVIVLRTLVYNNKYAVLFTAIVMAIPIYKYNASLLGISTVEKWKRSNPKLGTKKGPKK
jgi:hypothetical protein